MPLAPDVSSRFLLFFICFFTSLLCSRLRLSRLLFVTSPCFLLKVSISSLSVCYVIAVFWASTVSSSILLRQCRPTTFSRLPLFHYLVVTSVLCSRLRLSFLLFVTSLCFLLIVSLFHYLFVTSVGLLCSRLRLSLPL